MLSRLILLGPQRRKPIVAPAVDFLLGARDRQRGQIALITAGWEEREAEDQELREHLQRRAMNLALWARVEAIFEQDPELLTAMRLRHDALRRLQDVYRLRLDHLLEAARVLLRRVGDGALLEPDRQSAIDMVRMLDREHEARVQKLHDEFEARWQPAQRDAVRQHRRELDELIGEAPCVCVAGGHIGILLHRLRLFGGLALLADKPVVAWSAGAMALAPRIVLFHDDPPQGSANAEVMEAGLAGYASLVPLPHASRRLKLKDERAVALMARRFQPDPCVALDDECRLDWDGRRWSANPGTRKLAESGRLLEVGA
jgi:hypothetical protein